MGRELIAMGMGMGIMPWRQHRFHLRAVGWVGIRVIHRVMTGFFLVTLLVPARL